MANRDSPFPCLSTFVLLTIDRPRAPVLVASQTALEYGEKEGRCAMHMYMQLQMNGIGSHMINPPNPQTRVRASPPYYLQVASRCVRS